MPKSQNEEFRQLIDLVRTSYKQSGMTIAEFVHDAGCSTKTWYLWTTPEQPNLPDLSDGRKRRGVAGTIIHLLIAIGENDIHGWLRRVDLEKYSYLIEDARNNIEEKRAAANKGKRAEERNEPPMTDDDWSFMERMRNEFGENLTFSLLVELFKKRKRII